jgi:poly(hydroxyalkanoate) depolymerase family esterase
MTKSLTKTWLRGFKRLMKTLPATQADWLHETNVARPPSRVEPTRTVIRHDPPDSRVRPRPAAWAKGQWTRSYHSAPPTPGQLVNHLSYGLYIPLTRPMRNLPLVVMLHGCSQTIDEFAAGTRMNLVADAHGFAVLYPEQSKHAHAHRCWHWYDDEDTGGRGEARAVTSLIEALVEQYGFDAERVYLAGLSAGAGLATLIATHFPDSVAAVGLHSAPAFGEAHSGMTAMDVMRRGAKRDPIELVDALIDVASYPGMPAAIVHGDEDHVVAPLNAEQLALQFQRLNGLIDAHGAPLGGTVREVREGSTTIVDYAVGARSVVRLCRVADLGHAWAGGDEAIPFHSHEGPDASALMWQFFRSQRRRTLSVASSGMAGLGR